MLLYKKLLIMTFGTTIVISVDMATISRTQNNVLVVIILQ